jgi:hypothetical protein
LEHDGRVRWVYRPTMQVRLGADAFGPSWIVDRVYETPDPAGGRGKALWAVVQDLALFPSAVQRLDSRTGRPLSTYWSNGHILAVALDAEGGRHRLFVGASHNERRAGSLAVLDALRPDASAPAELEKYRCTSCPPGAPQVFLVFPRPFRFGRTDATGPVARISPKADGGLTIGVDHAGVGADLTATAIYQLDPFLAPTAVDTADNYLRTFHMLVERGGAPAGAPDTIDPLREFLPILRWDPASRRYVEVPLRR